GMAQAGAEAHTGGESCGSAKRIAWATRARSGALRAAYLRPALWRTLCPWPSGIPTWSWSDRAQTTDHAEVHRFQSRGGNHDDRGKPAPHRLEQHVHSA